MVKFVGLLEEFNLRRPNFGASSKVPVFWWFSTVSHSFFVIFQSSANFTILWTFSIESEKLLAFINRNSIHICPKCYLENYSCQDYIFFKQIYFRTEYWLSSTFDLLHILNNGLISIPDADLLPNQLVAVTQWTWEIHNFVALDI